MPRITTLQKKIADAHIAAFLAGKFDDPALLVVGDLKKFLMEGKTFSLVYSAIQTNYTSVTGQLLASPKLLGHLSKAYKADIYKGFKTELSKYQIN